MDVDIRGYGPGDLFGMTAMWNRVVDRGMAFSQKRPLSPEETEGFFSSQFHCDMAVLDGRIVELYILHLNNVCRCEHIFNASVADKEMANKGIEMILMEDFLRVAGGMSFRIIRFNAVVQENASALYLYEKVGFRRMGMISANSAPGRRVPHDCSVLPRVLIQLTGSSTKGA